MIGVLLPTLLEPFFTTTVYLGAGRNLHRVGIDVEFARHTGNTTQHCANRSESSSGSEQLFVYKRIPQ